jgi:carbon monoxide dehydrogenase subunit G
MRFTRTVEIDAQLDQVWVALIDVERWPEWTASVRRVEKVDNGPLVAGSRVLVEQPKLRTSHYRVDVVRAPEDFTWTTRSPGVTTRAAHVMSQIGDGRVRMELTLDLSGPLAPLIGRLYGSLMRWYLGLEAEGLKRRCEQPDAA